MKYKENTWFHHAEGFHFFCLNKSSFEGKEQIDCNGDDYRNHRQQEPKTKIGMG